MNIDATLLAWVVPVVVVIVQALKQFGALSQARWQPVLGLAVGVLVVGLCTLCWPPDGGVAIAVGYWLLHGLLAGLAACGLYDVGAKPVFNGLATVINLIATGCKE